MIMSFLLPCWRPFQRCLSLGTHAREDGQDAFLWHMDATQGGLDFSIAVVQANEPMEDHSQVRIGPFGTLIGVYDGHGGPEVAQFINGCLFTKIETLAQSYGAMSSAVLKEAVRATEDEFMGLVRRSWRANPRIVSAGSCCLVGVISGNNLYVANVGDARAVLGTVKKGITSAVRLSQEHNANSAEVREELKAQHPDDPNIVVLKHGVWRVKGIIQVSRSIGDLYLKDPEFSRELTFSHAGLPLSVNKPVLSAEPAIHERNLVPDDQFLVFASDGLWEHLNDQDVVSIVQSSPQNGIAKHLVKTALQRAAKQREMRYADLRRIEPGVRRYFHDDISVVVVYMDSRMAGSSPSQRGRSLCMNQMDASVDVFSSSNL